MDHAINLLEQRILSSVTKIESLHQDDFKDSAAWVTWLEWPQGTKDKDKTLPEAQRTQGIASKT